MTTTIVPCRIADRVGVLAGDRPRGRYAQTHRPFGHRNRMPRRRPQPDLRVVSSERLGELIGYLTEGLAGRSGQAVSSAVALTPSGSAVPARLEELQRLFSAISEENGHLTDHV